MAFNVTGPVIPDTSVVPANLMTFNKLTTPTVTRTLTLNEVQGPAGPVAMFLDGRSFMDPTAVLAPKLGTTEMWQVVNLTADTHPIHLHLVNFQLVSRQNFNVATYTAAYNAANPVIPVPVGGAYTPIAPGPYLLGAATGPAPGEGSWKDTLQMPTGQITRIIVRWSQTGPATVVPFGFDATAAPGYVWHCHILSHEEKRHDAGRSPRFRKGPDNGKPPTKGAAHSGGPSSLVRLARCGALSPAWEQMRVDHALPPGAGSSGPGSSGCWRTGSRRSRCAGCW